MSHIPVPYTPVIRPANTKTVVAIQDGSTLVIYVEAFIHVGSRIIVEPVKVEAIAPMFRISEVLREWPYAHPINLIYLQKEAFGFDIRTTRLVAIVASGLDDVQVVPVQPGIHSDQRVKEPEPGWLAIHDFMPFGEARLTITGTVETPTPGWTLYLERVLVEEPDPDVNYLKLVRIPPTKVVNQLVTSNLVVYQTSTDVHYKTVHIGDEGMSITVPVQEVS
jgi:hypothetical protein